MRGDDRAAATSVDVLPGVELSTRATRGVAFGVFSGGGPLVVIVAVRRARARCSSSSSRHLHRRLVWLPTGLLLGGAAGNLIDRVRDGAVTDFVKLPALAGVQRRRHRDHGRRARRCSTCSKNASRVTVVPPEAAGERLDVFLAARAGLARRGAAADRRRAGARRRRAAAEAPRARRRRDDDGASRRRRPRAAAVAAERDVRDRLRGRAPARDRQAGRASSCIPARGHRGTGRSCRRSPAAWPAATTPSDRASCTGSTATRPACSCWPATRRCTRRCRRALRAREITREYLALVEGRPPARARHDRRPARPRPPRAHADLHRHRRPAPRGHPLRDSSESLPDYTLLRVRLETGRTHQIRAHLLAIGHPGGRRPRVRRHAGGSA